MESPTILCVDDDELILSTLGEQLEQALGDRYDIALATSGTQALELIEALKAESVLIPLILSDQNMGEMSGDRFLIQAHALLPETLKILFTGEHRLEAIRDALNQANLYRYIAKPWEETDLLLTVKEALRSYEQNQRLKSQQRHLAQMNHQLAYSLATLEAILDATADGILVLNQASEITHFNHRLPQLLALATRPEFCGDRDSLRLPIQQQLEQNDELWQLLNTPMNGSLSHEVRIKTAQGIKQLECCAQPQKIAGQIIGRVWSFRDVTERKQAEAQIQHQMEHDYLTGIANRVQFNRYLAEQLDKARKRQSLLAIMFVDLDHFKQVNDTLGHQVGDALLCQVAERLQQCSRYQDLIARWGGDEFTLVLPNLVSSDDSCEIAQRILDALRLEFLFDQQQLHATASIGIAVYPDDGDTAKLLLQHADIALYQAKAKGRNAYVRFNQQV